MARDFQRGLRFLGIESSPAFVQAPEGNGCAGRCSPSARPTTRPGWSSGTASGRPPPSGRSSFHPRPWPG